METTSTIKVDKTPTADRVLKKLFVFLSWYPLIWVALTLIGGLLKSHSLVYFGLATLALYMFIGSIVWFTLLTCFCVYKKLTIKQILINATIFIVGAIIAYCVYEYDILSSGVKYMD